MSHTVMKGPSSACVPLLMFNNLSTHSPFGPITMDGAASYMINPTVSFVPTYRRPLGGAAAPLGGPWEACFLSAIKTPLLVLHTIVPY